jgi:hypothetical protein
LDSALMPPTRLLLLGDEEDMERKMQLQARHRVGFLATVPMEQKRVIHNCSEESGS